VLGAAAARGAAAAADRSDSLYRSESASAAALAAVAGLRPSITVPPPRSAKPGRRGGVGLTTHDGSFHTGPQLPSVEETKAAVMAALGSGPRPSAAPLPHSGSSSSLTGAQDEGAEGPAQLRKGSRGTLEGPAAPRRNVVAATGLFSNVIGQLRRQSTARESADTQDGGDEGQFRGCGLQGGTGRCALAAACGVPLADPVCSRASVCCWLMVCASCLCHLVTTTAVSDRHQLGASVLDCHQHCCLLHSDANSACLPACLCPICPPSLWFP
jgi:hypothetical protein